MNLLLVIRELELGSCKGIRYMLIILQVGAGGHGELANRNMTTGPHNFSKAAMMTVWNPSFPTQHNKHFTDTDDVEKVEMNWNTEYGSQLCHKVYYVPQIQRNSWAWRAMFIFI